MAFEFTDSNVREVIASGKPVLVDCWAPWCGPCVSMTPIIDSLAAEYEGRAVVGKYNVDEESDLGRLAGSQPKATLAAKLDELIG